MANKYVLGVDIGTSSIKTLLGTADESGKLAVSGAGYAPTRGFDRGTLVDARQLAGAVKEATDCAVMAAGVSAEAVYLGLGGLDLASVTSIGSIAPASARGITNEDIERACQAAAAVAVPDDRRILHMIPTEYWVDGQIVQAPPVGHKGSRLEVETVLVSGPASVIENLLQALSSLSVNVDGVYANCVVVAQSLPSTAGPFVVIDMGAWLTDLAIFSDGKIRLAASLPLGSDYITADIIQGLGVGRSHAEDIKRYYARLNKDLRGQGVVLDCNDYGTTDKHVPYDFLFKIVESRVEEIVEIVHKYLEPLVSRYDIQQVWLAGGSALLPSISESLANSFQLPVGVVRLENELAAEYAHPANACSYGLIKYAAGLDEAVPVSDNGFWRQVRHKIRGYF